MVKKSGRGGRPSAKKVQKGASPKGAARHAQKTAAGTKRAAADAAASRAPEQPRPFRLGIVPGATPGKWIDTAKKRFPHVTIELVPLTVATQREELADVDAALVRLPIAQPDELHIVRLYDEQPVVVASVDSALLAADELTAADLADEVLITPLDDVLGPLDLPTRAPVFPALETTADAIATVATGIGITIVPMSLARLHHRRDVDYRVLEGGPTSTVAYAWPRESENPDVDAFLGVIRGRTANSSR